MSAIPSRKTAEVFAVPSEIRRVRPTRRQLELPSIRTFRVLANPVQSMLPDSAVMRMLILLNNWTRGGYIGEIDENGEIALTAIGARRFAQRASVVSATGVPSEGLQRQEQG